ncbi:MAG: tryptophan synthase subunit alpha [Actinomycetota bacterium]
MSAADDRTRSSSGTATDDLTPIPVEQRLGAHLVRRRADGAKLLLPYVTAGIGEDWLELVEAVIEAGADAVEIGIPFSDPAMDGTTIQEASVIALDNGITPAAALHQLSQRQFGVPLIAMTYYNLVYRYGHRRFAAELAAAGGRGTILPDLPIEHAADWERAAADVGIDNVLLASPVTDDERLQQIVDRTAGFVYVVSTMGTTGERAGVDDAASVLSRRVKAVTDKPAIVGFGISNGPTAVEAARDADGVVVASALLRRLIDGGTIEDAAALVAEIRTALDQAYPPG